MNMKWPWVAIFKTGTHTDFKGKVHTVTADDLEKTVTNYSAGDHAAPVVIGHPKLNGPAFGWVKELKTVGNVLWAKLDKVQEDFKGIVQEGRYQKISASFYADGGLRHVGFLGATPPAIKGLPEIAFNEAAGETTFEFADTDYRAHYKLGTVARIFRAFREYIIEKDGADKADKIVGNWDIDYLAAPPPPEEPKNGMYAEPENTNTEGPMDEKKLKELQDQITEQGRQIADFSEKQKTLEAENKALKDEKAKAQSDAARKEHKDFCDALVKEGKLTPAMSNKIVEFMGVLGAAGSIDFAEGDKTEKKEALGEFKGFLKALPKVVDFSEHAVTDLAGKPEGDQHRSEGAAIAATVNPKQ
ncbi:MAG TPA: hypothetical protein PLV42_06930 [bacterium]|nr:hypothetical protein [bacterium]